ncbi:hypothetical protein LIER_29785 [Lithospermum erythrorhizon]|uniref:Uncharacterized protein n=1 Tax=Lithospermum erythrorhizon TaxID=34254 RepID=A0AAV3RKC7_LITER
MLLDWEGFGSLEEDTQPSLSKASCILHAEGCTKCCGDVIEELLGSNQATLIYNMKVLEETVNREKKVQNQVSLSSCFQR